MSDSCSPPETCCSLPPYLAHNPELDVATGLKHVQHNLESYLKLLTLFTRINQSEVTKLGECISTGDSANAKLIAHRLKGSSATLGASNITILATAIDRAIKETNSCTQLQTEAQEIMLAMSRLATSLRSLVASEDT